MPRPAFPGEEFANVVRDCNDVMSSQGVRFAKFLGVIPGIPVDLGFPLDDPVFNKKGKKSPAGGAQEHSHDDQCGVQRRQLLGRPGQHGL